MELREIMKESVVVHDAVEVLERTVKSAIDDGRFKMDMEEHRKFRDLIDDTQKILNRAWRGSLQIPLTQEKKVAGNRAKNTIC